MVAFGQRAHIGADINHDPRRPLVAEDGGEQPLRIRAGQGVLIGAAYACGLELNQDLTFPGAFELHCLNAEWFASLEGQGGPNVQDPSSPGMLL